MSLKDRKVLAECRPTEIKFLHGGRRTGAGRKPLSNPTRIVVILEPRHMQQLDRIRKAVGMNRSQVFRHLLDTYIFDEELPGFKGYDEDEEDDDER
jgi:hypothetical protein